MNRTKQLLSVLLALCILLCGPLWQASAETDDFDYRVRENTAIITNYSGGKQDVVIPGTLGGYPVAGLDADAFSGNPYLVSVKLPESMTEIANEAFSHCSKLERVEFGGALRRIGVSAFMGCTALQSFTIPDSVTDLGAGCFQDCTALETVTVGSGVTTLPGDLFGMCTALKTVRLGQNTQRVSFGTFSGCFCEGGDLYVSAALVSFPETALDPGFAGVIHCYTESPLYETLFFSAWRLSPYTMTGITTQTDAPLSVAASPLPQAVPTAGLHVLALYAPEDGFTVPPLELTAYTVPETMEFRTPGTVDVPVRFEHFSASYPVTVTGAAAPASLRIAAQPADTVYYAGDGAQTIDTTGLRVELVYTDGTAEDVTSQCTLPGTHVFSAAGTETIVVRYGKMQTSFTVAVQELALHITANGSVPSGVFKKKIGLFSSYRRNPVQLGIDGLPEDAIRAVEYRVIESGMQVDANGTLTHRGLFAATGVVQATVTDAHGGTHTATLRVIFYRFALQILLRFAKYR